MKSKSGLDPKRREDITYESLLQHAKEHEMTVKDFNRHKSNGGTAIATSVDEIRTFKQKKGNGYRAKAAQVDHVVNAAHHTHQENVQHSVRNAINVD